ncbi:hypothetical protein BX667DRAFT_495814 [Coemansia mojavensis]|nr:hypothetical protein BX667DRAFT_495814 [Coemansia mojavensis]
MTRGNQRELARQRNQKKQQQQNKGKSKTDIPFAKKKEMDADIMRKKQEKSAEKLKAAK